MDFAIADHLENPQKGKGTCKACKKVVAWSRDKLGAHKRVSCAGSTAVDKDLFRIRKHPKSPRTEASSSHSMDTDETKREPYELTEEIKDEIDAALAKLFFRTGIPFKVADSEAFRSFVKLLNPSYAEVMPKSPAVSGKLLDKEYGSSFGKLTTVLEGCNDLTLISDGWTNVRGDHIVNFLVKAPGHSAIFFKSFNTSGITQNTDAIVAAISGIIEELGAGKFTAVVTDNAPVMRAAWELLEEQYPNISCFGCAAHALNLLIKDLLVPHKDGKKIMTLSTI